MSRQAKAEEYFRDYEYVQAKKLERKKDKSFRGQRKNGKRVIWEGSDN